MSLMQTRLYAVKTTGIVCRVGCASRAPRPENVVWVADLADALHLSERHLRRLVRAETGLSPRELAS